MITQSPSTRSSADLTIAQRIARFATAFSLCLILTAGMAMGSVTTANMLTDLLPGHAYVHYTTDHLLSPTGDVVEMLNTTPTSDGHVYDLYGNLATFNSDGTIFDVNNAVVGFVYHPAP